MSPGNETLRVAIVGAGTIGSSWAALCLAHGFGVVATDPAPNAEINLRAHVARAWKTLAAAGLSPQALPDSHPDSQPDAYFDRLHFTTDLGEALEGADFVQESGPELRDFKIRLFAAMDRTAPPDSILASSTSWFTADVLASQCGHPGRCIVGHPLNPPHVIPLVEVVGGAQTSPGVLERAMAFYASLGKKPILLRKAIHGHVVNRLQAALYKEILFLVQQGVLGIADADDLISNGPGLRWAVMGPSLQWHLAGGPGGIHHFMEQLMDPLCEVMDHLGAPEFTETLRQTVIDGVARQAGDRSVEQLADRENQIIVDLLALRARTGA
jgi:3-hydroxyacyl-CoA dehydrogenase